MNLSWSGHCFEITENRTVTVSGPSRKRLHIPPLTDIRISNELLSPSPAPAYDAVPALNRRATHHTWGVPGSLQPQSLEIFTGGEKLRAGTDYELASPDFGGIKFLRPEAFTSPCYLNYRLKYQRVDAIAVNSDGEIQLFCGRESLVLPRWPLLPPGWEGICRIHSFFSDALTADCMFPIPDRRHSRLINYEVANDMAARMPDDWFGTNPPPHPDAGQVYTRHLDYTLSMGYTRAQAFALQERIREQGEFKLVYFGDSVTQGGDVDREHRFPRRLNQWLEEHYHGIDFSFVNAAIGGTGSGAGRERFERDVLTHRPDAVTVMFVLNDFRIDDKTILDHHRYFLDELRRINAVPVFITPNYNTGVWMEGLDHGVERIRRFCREENVICVDVYRLWQELRRYGIPYETMLANGINHPDHIAAGMFFESLKLLFS